ncbi:hypothetical protein P3T40_006944 [Paraburkholderia sp. EB58]|jgi:hypothetical protein|uniref:hypothetical protein n=1 Tax=Paraburkholderia sp. EB58 TaxID=3035125 RepID=UPI003D23EDBC
MPGKYAPLLIMLLVFPLAFDYKSVDNNQGHLLQIALAVPPIITGILLALKGPKFRYRSQLRSFVIGALVVTVVGSIVPQLINGNEIGNYLRVLLAFILFLIGYLAGCHPWSESRSKSFDFCIFAGMALSMVMSFVFGMATGGSIDDVRYHIISPVLLGFQGTLLYDIVMQRSRSKIALALFVATMVIELLSVTRSLLIGTVLLFSLATWLAAPTIRHLIKSLLRTFVVVVALAGVVMIGAELVFPSVLDHWTQRIFFAESTKSGKDPTTLTRLAEMEDQYDQVTSTGTSMFLGMGYGHHFGYAKDYIPELEDIATRQNLEDMDAWEAGHNFWVYQFFAGGILFGTVLPIALLYALYRCSVSYRRWRRAIPNAVFLPNMGRYLMVVSGMVVTTIGGNPMGARYSGLIYGLALGLLVAAHSKGILMLREAQYLENLKHPRGRGEREKSNPARVEIELNRFAK